MPTFILNKLVRDAIPERQVSDDQNPVYYKLDPAEHAEALVAKIIEEAQEIPVVQSDEAVAEIADVQQALDDLKALLGITDADVQQAQLVKREHSGGFRDGMFVETVRVAEGSKWADYYRSEPERFTEITDETD